jgi:hypothetical protein
MNLQHSLPNKRLSSLALGGLALTIYSVMNEGIEWLAYAIIPAWALFLICVWRFSISTKRKWLLWITGIAHVVIGLEIASYILYFETYRVSPMGAWAWIIATTINIVSAVWIFRHPKAGTS